MEVNCDKYPFDYNKHIIIKNILTSTYKHFVGLPEMSLFQGIEIARCENCLVQGYPSFSMPFQFEEITFDEVHCTLIRMGLKEITMDEMDIMPILDITDDGVCCKECLEALEDTIDELDDFEIPEIIDTKKDN